MPTSVSSQCGISCLLQFKLRWFLVWQVILLYPRQLDVMLWDPGSYSPLCKHSSHSGVAHRSRWGWKFSSLFGPLIPPGETEPLTLTASLPLGEGGSSAPHWASLMGVGWKDGECQPALHHLPCSVSGSLVGKAECPWVNSFMSFIFSLVFPIFLSSFASCLGDLLDFSSPSDELFYFGNHF